MKNRMFLIAAIILLTIGTIGPVQISTPTFAISSLEIKISCKRVIDKEPGESFNVEILFHNKGETKGSWSVAVTFEGEEWSWQSEKKILILGSSEQKILLWEGSVPKDVPANSVARLVLYYNDEFVALNWWIHVVGDSELQIVSSKVH
jgi:hypothetical protein